MEKELRARHERMKMDRSNHEQRWDDNGILFSPLRGDVTTKRSEGDNRVRTVLDTTGITAMDVVVNFIHGQLFGINWVAVTPFVLEALEDEALRYEAYRVGQITSARLLDTLDRSNFSQEAFPFIRDELTYGTAIMRRRNDAGWKFRTIFPGSAWIAESADDDVDIVHICHEYTGDQLITKFKDKLPSKVAQQAKAAPGDKFEVIYCSFPKRDSVPWTMQIKGDGNWASVTMLAGEQDGAILEKKSVKRNPFIVSRYDKVNGHIWGYGPSDQGAADMKSLNLMAEEELKAVAMDLRPPLLSHEGIFRSSIKPGRKVAVKGRLPNLENAARYLRSESNFEAAARVKGEMQMRVKTALLGDVLGEKDTEPRSAEESIARQRRAFSRLAGPANRLEREFLTPVIEGLVGDMLEAGELPELEEFFANLDGDIKVNITYRSPLLIAQREASIQPLLQTVGEMANLANLTQNPAWIEPYDVDGVHALVREARNVPAGAYYSPAELEAQRTRRQQIQSAQQGIEMAKGVSEIQKNQGGAGAIAQ